MVPTFAASKSNIAFNTDLVKLPMGQLCTGIGYASNAEPGSSVETTYIGGEREIISVSLPTPQGAVVAPVVKAKK